MGINMEKNDESGEMIIFHLSLDFPEIAGVPFPFPKATFLEVNRLCEVAS